MARSLRQSAHRERRRRWCSRCSRSWRCQSAGWRRARAPIGRGRREPRSSPSSLARCRRPDCEPTSSLSRKSPTVREATEPRGPRAIARRWLTSGPTRSCGIRASRRRLSLRLVPGDRREGSSDRADPEGASRRGARLLAVDTGRRSSRQGGRGRRRLRARRLRRRARIHRACTPGHLLLRRQGEERVERRRGRAARLQLGARTVRRHARRSAGLLDSGCGDRRHRRTGAGSVFGLDRGAGAGDASGGVRPRRTSSRTPNRPLAAFAGRCSSRLRPRRAGHQRQRDRRRRSCSRSRGSRARDTRSWVRFAFWGAEELGLFGSTPYARSADRSRIVGYLNFDVLGSPSRERTVYEGGPFAAHWLAYFERRGLPATQVDIGGRTDHFPFEQIGIPRAGCSQAATPATTVRATGSRASTSSCSTSSPGLRRSASHRSPDPRADTEGQLDSAVRWWCYLRSGVELVLSAGSRGRGPSATPAAAQTTTASQWTPITSVCNPSGRTRRQRPPPPRARSATTQEAT